MTDRPEQRHPDQPAGRDGSAERVPQSGADEQAQRVARNGADERAARIAQLAAAIGRVDRAAPSTLTPRRTRLKSLAPRRRLPGPMQPDCRTSTPPGQGSGVLLAGRYAQSDRRAAPIVDGRPPPDDGGGDEPGDPVAVAKAICLRLLTGAARTRADLATALRRRGIADEVADAVLDRLTEVGLIDDAAYAEAFVAAEAPGPRLGRAALRAELRRKGVDRGRRRRCRPDIDEEAERDARAVELVVNGWTPRWATGPAARRRLIGLLARRGYPPGLARQVVDEALRGFGAERRRLARLSADAEAIDATETGTSRSDRDLADADCRRLPAASRPGGRGRLIGHLVATPWPRRAAVAGRLDPWCLAP